MNEMGLAALIESGLRLLSGSVSGQMSLVSTHDVSAMIADTRYGSRRSRTASSPPRKGEMIRATVAASLSWVSWPASSVGLCAKRSACAHRQSDQTGHQLTIMCKPAPQNGHQHQVLR